MKMLTYILPAMFIALGGCSTGPDYNYAAMYARHNDNENSYNPTPSAAAVYLAHGGVYNVDELREGIAFYNKYLYVQQRGCVLYPSIREREESSMRYVMNFLNAVYPKEQLALESAKSSK